MLRLNSPQRNHSAFAAMVYAGISASLILLLGGWFLGFTRQTADIKPVGNDWSHLSAPPPIQWPAEGLNYRVRWNGVRAGTLEVKLRTEESASNKWTVISYAAHTNTRLKWAWSWRSEGTTWLEPKTLLPLVEHRHTVENGDSERCWTTFRRTHRRVSHFSMDNGGEPPEWARIHFVHGLNLPALFARICAVRFQRGEEYTFDVIEDATAYAVCITPKHRQTLSVGNKTLAAQELKLVIHELRAEKVPDEGERSDPTVIRIWVDDQVKAPVQLRYTGAIGKVTVERIFDSP